MSHFYLYPLLLSQGYPVFQIQQILHSFGLFPNYQQNQPDYSFLPLQDQNQAFRGKNQGNLMIQQENKSVSVYINQNLTCDLPSNQKNSQQKQDPIRQQQAIKQERDSHEQLYPKNANRVEKLAKNIKKNQKKKMSLKQKREKQMKRNQAQNSKRNIIPNQIHQMLSILFKKKKSSHMVQKLLKKFSSVDSKNSFSTLRFYLYQSLLKQKISHYANEQSLKVLLRPLQPCCEIYSLEEQSLYCKIGLTLINYFLNNQTTLIILNSQRIKSENKLDHLKTKRYLKQVLKQIISLNHKNETSGLIPHEILS